MIIADNDSVYDKLEDKSKDLDLLFKIDDLLINHNKNLEDVFKDVIKIIPTSFRFPDYCEIRIEFDNIVTESNNFILSNFKIYEDFVIESNKKGRLTVVYRGLSNMDKGVFTVKERQLLKTIANKISAFIIQKSLRQTIENLKNQQSNTYIYNDESIRNWLEKKSLNDDEIAKLLKVKLQFNKGETLCKQGTFASYIILLSKGLAKNFVEGNTEKAFNFKFIKAYDFIGLSTIYNNNSYSFSAAALTNCEAFLIDIPTLKNIIDNNKAFANEIFVWYCQTINNHLKRMSTIANKQSMGRLADALLYLSNEIFNGASIKNTISRKEIAAYAAMSTENAVRFMSDFKKDGVIEINSKEIIIKKWDVLKIISRS